MNTAKSSRIKKMSPLLYVADIDRSIEFYTKQFNYALDFRYEDFYAGISKDSYSIHLKVNKHLITERKTHRNNEDLNIVFSVSNIEDLYKELVTKAIEIVQPLRSMPYGKEFYVADPDGNLMAFVEEV